MTAPTRHQIVTATTMPRVITASNVPPETHDAFEAMAKQRGMTKGALSRKLVEAAVRNPQAMQELIATAADEVEGKL